MRTYLLIGIIVQAIIVFTRVYIRKVASFKYFDVITWIVFIGMCIFSALIWPITIWFEIKDAK